MFSQILYEFNAGLEPQLIEHQLVMKLSQTLCYRFLLSISFVRWPAQNRKGIEMYMSNKPVKAFGLALKTKQFAGSRFVEHKTKQLCKPPLKYVGLYRELVLSTMMEHRKFQAFLGCCFV